MYRPHPEVIATDLESELILLDPRSQEMFSLNPTGREVWLALPAAGPEELVARLVEAFDTTAEAAVPDVRALLAELVEAGLVVEGDAEHG